MSISNITEEQIFHTLGRGKAPDFKLVVTKQRREPVKPKPETVKLTEDPILKEIAESIKTLAINISELTRSILKFMPWIVFIQLMLLFVIAILLFKVFLSRPS